VRVIFLFAMALMAGCGVADAQDLTKKDTVMQGGPLDQLVLGPLVTADGQPGFGLKPSSPGVAPVPEPMLAVVTGLLRAYELGKKGSYQPYLAADATGTWCEGPMTENCREAVSFDGFTFGEHCVANTPFYEGGSDVRLEWSYKGQLYYISFVKFSGGKIQSVVTTRASVPAIFNPDAKG